MIDTHFALSAGALRDLGRVTVAAADPRLNPLLANVLVDTIGRSLRFTATDRYRLSYATTEISWLSLTAPEIRLVIDAKALSDFAKTLKKTRDDTVAVHATDNSLTIRHGADYIALAAYDDSTGQKFPDLDRLRAFTPGPQTSTALDPTFLADAATIVPDCTIGTGRSKKRARSYVTLKTPQRDPSPVLFSSDCPVHGVALSYLLMPVRVS